MAEPMSHTDALMLMADKRLGELREERDRLKAENERLCTLLWRARIHTALTDCSCNVCRVLRDNLEIGAKP